MLTIQTISVAPTSVQNPWMKKPATIALVITSISIETKNQATPRVRIASGKVISRSTGLSTVLSTPNTAAARSNAPALETSTPLSTAAATPSTSALVNQEMTSRTESGGAAIG